MSGEAVSPIIGGLGLTVFAGAIVAIRSGALDAVVAAVIPGAGMVVLVVLAVATLGAARHSPRPAVGRMAVGHAHGERRVVARHEAGHVAAALAVGGQVISATASDSVGLVRAVLPDVRATVTFLRAGRYAAGTRRGCGGDERAERAELRDVPRGERRQLVRDADRDADRIVRQYCSQIRRDADTLERRGRL